ncbi:MAG: phosphotransferase, partial [Candidatus Marsarchaeota archaeon]|nr:phosphotransferase [Candidatus Marsarchaeota archaeon]
MTNVGVDDIFLKRFIKTQLKEDPTKVIYKRINAGHRANSYIFRLYTNKRYVIQFYDEKSLHQPIKRCYIYTLTKNYTFVPVPKVFFIGKFEKYSYIILEKLNGKTVDKIKKTDIKYVLEKLGEYLYDIHNNVNVGKKFGWIEGKFINFQGISNIEYLNNEIIRIKNWLVAINRIKEAKSIADYFCLRIKKLKLDVQPVLVWSEINKKNLLFNNIKGEKIVYLLDPGSAKVAPREIDILAAEQEFNNNEFKYILKGYLKNGKNKILKQ